MPKPKTQEQIDKDNLFEYYKTLVPNASRVVFNTQYKKLITDEPSWTAKQIMAALKFAVEHQGLTITSLAIVPYVMNDCKEYYAWLRRIKSGLVNFKPSHQKHIVKRQERTKDIFT